jgi:penicillin-binding protein 1A
MVTAYSAFPGRGQRVTPLYVSSIADNNGVTVATFQPRRKEVFSEDSYYKMLPILRDVVDHGTGVRLRYRYGLTAPMGGKTGTTNDNSDGWFMGFTPSLIAGTWVGGEERSICFDRMAIGQGANMALPIFAKFMKKVYADKTLPYRETESFYYPESYDPCVSSNTTVTHSYNDDEDEVGEQGIFD